MLGMVASIPITMETSMDLDAGTLERIWYFGPKSISRMPKRSASASSSASAASSASSSSSSSLSSNAKVAKISDKAVFKKVSKRDEGVIKWDDYFMAVAFLSSMRSKDPSTQVGACIVNTDNRIVGIGYNGFPRGCSDDILPWSREAENELDTKYPYVCHAEVNAIINKNSADVSGCRIFVALFPCNECAKMIIQSGITEVVFLSDKYHDTPSMRASRRMLTMAGVAQRQMEPTQQSITIDFAQIR
jgi:dCMP deaminase